MTEEVKQNVGLGKKDEEKNENGAGGIGERIARLRREKGLTQSQLAEQLGISAQAVSKWESGLSCPDIMTLVPLARIFDVTVDTLLSGEGGQQNTAVHLEKDSRGTDRKTEREMGRKDPITKIGAQKDEIHSLKVEIGAAQVFIRSGSEFSLELSGYDEDACCSEVVDGEWRVWDKGGIAAFLGIREIFFERKAILTVPAGYRFRRIRLGIGAGKVMAEGLSSDSCKLDVGAGQMTLVDFHSGDAVVECGLGDIKIAGSLRGKCRMECGMGSISAEILPLTDVGYDMNVGLGEIRFNGDGFGGIGGGHRFNAGAENFFKVDCGLGTVNIKFSETEK